MVRDQAALRLARPGAAHQGAGRLAVASRARVRRRARGGADDLRRAAAQPAPDGQGRPRSRRGPLRVDRLHLGQRGQGGAREVRGVRPRRPRVLRPQDRRRRRQDRRGDRRLGPARRPGAVRRAVRCRPAGRLAAVRRRARPDQPGLPAARRHRHREPRRRPDRPGLGVRRRDGLPHGARDAAAGADPRRDQVRQVRRRRLHLVLDRAQPRRHRRQAAPLDDHRGHRAGHGQDRRGARPAGRRPGPEARRRAPRGRPRRLRRHRRLALLEAGEPVTKPSERTPTARRKVRAK